MPKGWIQAIRSISAIFSRSLPKQVALIAFASWALVLAVSTSMLAAAHSSDKLPTPRPLQLAGRTKPSVSPVPETAANAAISSPSPKPFRYVVVPGSDNPSPRPRPTWPNWPISPGLVHEGNNSSTKPSISADGRYTAFYSDASNLTFGDNNSNGDVFVRDTIYDNYTENASIFGNNLSSDPAISADGRYIAFDSFASNLVADANNTEDVFVREVFRRATIRASVSSTGAEGNGRSFLPSISANGRYVVFYSDASNLVAGDTNGTDDVFVRDTVARTTIRASINSSGGEGSITSCAPPPPTSPVSISDCSFRRGVSISADGRYVAFVTAASFDPFDANSLPDVYLRDLSTGKTTLVSVTAQGTAPVNGSSDSPAISADGRYVAFTSGASNLAPNDTNGNNDVFIRDLTSGTTTRVSVSSTGGESNNFSDQPSISADGRYVTFASLASNLVTGDTNNHSDIFIRDLKTDTTTRVSISSAGKESNADSFKSSISGEGRYVAFDSDASNLIPSDTNNKTDVFVRDLTSAMTKRVSEWSEYFYQVVLD